ncbi:MAG: MFS transporter [Thalassotalea sp.]
MVDTKSNVAKFSLIAAFGGFVFGLDAANISGALRFVSSQFELTSIQTGTVVGCALIGVIVALLFTGTLCERLGRKKVLLGIAFTYSLSSIISALAVNYEMLVIGRFIGGVAFASITVSAMYIGEIAPANQRGKFVSVNQLMIALGLLLAFMINYGLVSMLNDIPWLDNSNVWRFMLGAELIANAVWVWLLFSIPESPRWLIKKGKEQEAQDTFKLLVPAQELDKTINEIKASIQQDSQHSTAEQLKNLFSRKMWFVLAIAICYAIVNGATGMNAVLFFAPMVFEQVGMSVEDTFMQTITIGVVGLISTVIAIAFVEKLGRRFLTLAGLSFVVIAHASTWFGFKQASYEFDQATLVTVSEQFVKGGIEQVTLSKLPQLVGNTFDNDVDLKQALAEVFTKKELPLVSGPIINASIKNINVAMVLFGIFAFLAAFNMSIGPIMWVIFSEIFPNNVRSVALPFAALVQTVSSWSVQQFFPWQLDNFGFANTFFIYGGIGFVGLLVMIFILPETKGKSIEMIEKDLVKA